MFSFLLNRKKLLADSKKLGRWGERFTEKYLKNKGLRLLTRNYSFTDGEIDLIMVDRDATIVFVEVKTRASEEFSSAESAINYAKKIKLIKTARFFCKKYQLTDRPLRFDAAIVILGKKSKPQIRHYKNIFSG